MKKDKNRNPRLDAEIPGYPEIYHWPKQPVFPEEIIDILIYRDGGTVGVTIKANDGDRIEFFFDRELGRLCFGQHHTDDSAAFVKMGSPFEKELYSYLENARKRLDINTFSVNDIQVFTECFNKAKVYSGV